MTKTESELYLNNLNVNLNQLNLITSDKLMCEKKIRLNIQRI